MKIASITIFCNEKFRLDNWKKLYEEYKSDIALHIIVNNGNPEDTMLLKESFPQSLVLESKTNNMMASYNLALREILKDPDIDGIMQICNDIRIEKGGIPSLYSFLYSNDKYAMVSPILLQKDSDIVDSYGADINRWTLAYTHKYSRQLITDIKEDVIICMGLPAGIYIARRDYYEKFGFQDEGICMYADEVDMSLNAHKLGYLFATTKNIKSWHQHIYSPGKATRTVSAYYYMGRNHIYIAKKQCNRIVVVISTVARLYQYCKSMLASIIHSDGSVRRKNASYFLMGIIDAIRDRNPRDFQNK